ncbi:hypothetical protein [Dactylosporangium sp. NPDC049140]|jgi:hypothetical protein
MFRTLRRSRSRAEVRFCDGCATVSTPEQRVAARIERTRTYVAALTGPR